MQGAMGWWRQKFSFIQRKQEGATERWDLILHLSIADTLNRNEVLSCIPVWDPSKKGALNDGAFFLPPCWQIADSVTKDSSLAACSPVLNGSNFEWPTMTVYLPGKRNLEDCSSQ